MLLFETSPWMTKSTSMTLGSGGGVAEAHLCAYAFIVCHGIAFLRRYSNLDKNCKDSRLELAAYEVHLAVQILSES
jgi:hypothetical protein